MKEETEEKTLPATRKKISDARRKGQVSHSKDLITGFGLLIAVAYLLREWPTMRAQVMDLFDLVSASVDLPFAEVRQRALAHAVQALLIMIIPLVVMVFAGSVIAGMIGTLGPVFSFESVKLKFEHINPVQGAKRIFSLRNLVEFAKSVAKVGILTVAFWAVMSGFVRPLFETPACGDACLGPMVVSTLTPLAVTAAIAFVAIGLLDVLLQHRLFLRDMRMTRTEHKRELKDLEGDPLIRSERRRIRRQVGTGQMRAGVKHAVVVIAHGDKAVGLRYNRVDAQVPTVVSKGRDDAGREMLAEARRLGIPVIDDAAVLERLINRHAIGDRIRQDLYNPVARILVNLGL